MTSRSILYATLVAVPIGIGTIAQADEFTSKTMLKWCTSEAGSEGSNLCDAYVGGFINALQVVSAQSKLPTICLPKNFAPIEAKAVYMRMLRTVPALQELPPDVALWTALSAQFDCGKNSN